VPVIRGVSFESEKERDAYIIADNQHTIAGGWSFDKLTDWVKSFGSSATDDGFRGLGFQSMELDSLLGNFSQPEELPDEEEQSSGEETVSNDIDVTLNVKCPNCSHEWSVEKRKRKPKKSVSLKNAV
jgi:DNA-directed RNA polymerase subunit RPC12/RpoP